MKNNSTLNAIANSFARRTSDISKLSRQDDEIPRIKPVYCADGTSISVQASRKHYSFPRNNEGPYTEVEVGFPSKAPPASWKQYCTGSFDDKPCDTVYANVPVYLVTEFIDHHGGIRAEEAPKLILPPPPAPIKRTFLEQRRYNLTLADMGVPV